jgi:hypothetical protein
MSMTPMQKAMNAVACATCEAELKAYLKIPTSGQFERRCTRVVKRLEGMLGRVEQLRQERQAARLA